jgi:uncharacterized protein (TIGR03083 family)
VNTTIVDVATIAPISRAEAPALATTELARFVELLRALSPDDWRRPTDNVGWDVHATVSHVVGMAETQASLRELARQMRTARRETGDGAFIDALTALQVRERVDATPTQLVDALERVAPRAVKGRRRCPAPMRAIRLRQDPPFGDERWHMGFLMDVIFTRDPWMHRVDIARATGRELVLTPEHDGRLVADVVAEWSRRHGQPFRLTLSGPAGGTYVARTGGPTLELDAVDWCRALSGRGPADGLLATPVPF